MSGQKDWYILFKNHTDAMSLFIALKKAGYTVKISPTPRQASVCCGVSLLVKSTEMEGVKKYMEEHAASYEKIVELEKQIDVMRDRFC